MILRDYVRRSNLCKEGGNTFSILSRLLELFIHSQQAVSPPHCQDRNRKRPHPVPCRVPRPANIRLWLANAGLRLWTRIQACRFVGCANCSGLPLGKDNRSPSQAKRASTSRSRLSRKSSAFNPGITARNLRAGMAEKPPAAHVPPGTNGVAWPRWRGRSGLRPAAELRAS
jgi:hypothetical protein